MYNVKCLSVRIFVFAYVFTHGEKYTTSVNELLGDYTQAGHINFCAISNLNNLRTYAAYWYGVCMYTGTV